MEDAAPRPDSKDDSEKRVECRRVNKSVTPEEHQQCPYCFGTVTEVCSGRHETFCDYDPEKDPVSFGFPPDKGHFKDS
jgi:hypothetical protein